KLKASRSCSSVKKSTHRFPWKPAASWQKESNGRRTPQHRSLVIIWNRRSANRPASGVALAPRVLPALTQPGSPGRETVQRTLSLLHATTILRRFDLSDYIMI